MKISSIISGKKVSTISPNATIHELVTELDRHRIGALVVSIDGEKIETYEGIRRVKVTRRGHFFIK